MTNKTSKISGKRILITGGGGFIGSFLTENFYKDNKITLFDNGRRNAFAFVDQSIQEKVNLIKGDITDEQMVKKIVKGQDIIIHLAAIAGASFYEKDPLLTLNVNLFGTANLLKSLINVKIEKVIIFSSSEVYGPKAVNVSEEHLTCIGPITESRWSYAVSKVAVDHLVVAYFKKYGLPVTILRPFNIYGPRQVGEGAISNMLVSGIRDKKIFVSGDGLQKRAWCYISDMVNAINLICVKEVSGECFNIGNPNSYVTILELAKMIQALCIGSRIENLTARSSEVYDRVPNIDKAKQNLGFIPKVSLGVGLKFTYEWFRNNLKSFKS